MTDTNGQKIVTDFGAVGNGNTDDWEPIRRAIDENLRCRAWNSLLSSGSVFRFPGSSTSRQQHDGPAFQR